MSDRKSMGQLLSLVFCKVVGKVCQEPDCKNFRKHLHPNRVVCDSCGKILQSVTQLNLPVIFSTVALIVALAVSMAFFAENHSATPAAKDVVSGNATEAPQFLFVLSGSSTIGDELAATLVKAYMKSVGGTDITVTDGPDGKVVQALLPGNSTPRQILIAVHGSATGFEEMAKKKSDVIAMSSRKIKDSERAMLHSAGLGDMTAPSAEHILGLDGVAIIVHPGNPIMQLAKDMLVKIFSGQITDWSQVGGNSGPIQVYTRDENSGTFDTINSLIMGAQRFTDKAKRYDDGNKLVKDLPSDPHGIGFVSLANVNGMHVLAIADTGSGASLPTKFNVSTENYLLTRRLYLYISPTLQNKAAQDFVQFALSSQGQSIVSASGFVSQNIEVNTDVKSQQPIINPVWTRADKRAAYDQYVKASKGRLSLDFRFQLNSAQLDNKALKDVERVLQLVADGEHVNSKILLLGFADMTGDYDSNVRLSEERALAVKNALIASNPALVSRVMIAGFGSECAIAANDTAESREKNRRVEILLMP